MAKNKSKVWEKKQQDKASLKQLSKGLNFQSVKKLTTGFDEYFLKMVDGTPSAATSKLKIGLENTMADYKAAADKMYGVGHKLKPAFDLAPWGSDQIGHHDLEAYSQAEIAALIAPTPAPVELHNYPAEELIVCVGICNPIWNSLRALIWPNSPPLIIRTYSSVKDFVDDRPRYVSPLFVESTYSWQTVAARVAGHPTLMTQAMQAITQMACNTPFTHAKVGYYCLPTCSPLLGKPPAYIGGELDLALYMKADKMGPHIIQAKGPDWYAMFADLPALKVKSSALWAAFSAYLKDADHASVMTAWQSQALGGDAQKLEAFLKPAVPAPPWPKGQAGTAPATVAFKVDIQAMPVQLLIGDLFKLSTGVFKITAMDVDHDTKVAHIKGVSATIMEATKGTGPIVDLTHCHQQYLAGSSSGLGKHSSKVFGIAVASSENEPVVLKGFGAVPKEPTPVNPPPAPPEDPYAQLLKDL